MADRIYSAQIDYPFVYHNEQLTGLLNGILDCLLYMSPEDTFVTPPATPTGIGLVGAWFYDVAQSGSDLQYRVYVAAPADPDVYAMDEPYEDEGSVYVLRTFTVPTTPIGAIVTVRAAEDARSALTVNTGQIVDPGVLPVVYSENRIEPATVVPCTRKVTQVNVYNEFRASDPADRVNLPPDFLQEVITPGHSLYFNDGYNCNVTYNESTQTLRFTGGLGFGLGRPDVNPWDDTEEDFDDGVRDVNGINVQGIVPIEAGSGIILDATVVGELKLLVRNQGELQCPVV